MTQLNINLNMEDLTAQIQECNLNALTKSYTIALLNAYMEAERDKHVQAERSEQNDTRQDYRNGYYDREYMLPVGRIKLRVPRTRSGEFSTEVFEKYQRMDQALILTMIESVINGVSTRKVKKLVNALCGEEVSKSFVSNIMKRLDPEIKQFRERPLNLKNYRYVYVDAMYIDVRENHRIVSKAVYIAQGVNDDDYREIIGFMVSGQESEVSWAKFFKDLRARGLGTPEIVISDAHEGLKKAIKGEFLGASWQRCTVHFLKNIIDVMPKDSSAERHALKLIFKATNPLNAKKYKAEFEALVSGNPKFDKAVLKLDAGFDDAMQYLVVPELHQKHIRTTNSLERVNEEVRRRENVIRIFPNVASAVRLVGAVLMDEHENMLARRNRFLSEPPKKQ